MNKQLIIFLIGIILFISAGIGGWIKLHYGFNFIDEGYHMTESWRTTVGDDFLEDKTSSAIMQYTQINSIIFNLSPDITLLEFRKIQYCLTMTAIFILSGALFLINRRFWVLPYIFSLFAFTGLDPTGMISNLSYYTYPHFFLILHVSFLLMALHTQALLFRNILLFFSGLCLWGISFSVLHLSGIIIAPFVIYEASYHLKFRRFQFTRSDLLYISLPFCVCWIIFLSVFNLHYLAAVKESVDFHFSLSSHGNLTDMHLEPLKYAFACFLFILAAAFLLRIKKAAVALPLAAALSVLMYFIIKTALFSLIDPSVFYQGWFLRPMWFSAFLMAFLFFFFSRLLFKKISGQTFSTNDEFAFIILLPSLILCFSMGLFSGLGVLTVLHCSAPIIVGVLLFFDQQKKNHVVNLLMILFILFPFYVTTAWADWKFTYFDVSPEMTDTTITNGFGKGIKTNEMYAKLHDWLALTSKMYSSKNDYILTYVVSPMTYMIAKRRPSLDYTFTDLLDSPENINMLMKKMIAKNRQPAIAYAFERAPILYPVSWERNEYGLPQKQFDFIRSKDPITQYIKQQMEMVAEFKISEDYKIRFFVDRNRLMQQSGALKK